MGDMSRCEALVKEGLGLYIDFSRQRMTEETLQVRARGASMPPRRVSTPARPGRRAR
jgi:hypothetical protein